MSAPVKGVIEYGVEWSERSPLSFGYGAEGLGKAMSFIVEETIRTSARRLTTPPLKIQVRTLYITPWREYSPDEETLVDAFLTLEP